MFDIAFSELAVIGAVALVVLGPERLPKVARTAGHLFGRLQRYVATVKADLSREMEMSELSKVKQEVQEAARAFEQTAREHANDVDSEARNLRQSLEKPAEPPITTAPVDAATEPVVASVSTQSEILSAQDAAFASASATTNAEAELPVVKTPIAHRVQTATTTHPQDSLDFGVEPVHARRRKVAI
jgi:sec-independent protein translocase protein TatB